MSTGYVIPVDPSELASRFSFEEKFDEESLDECIDISVEDVLEFFASAQEDYENKIAPLLDRIPEREADLLYLYFIQEKRQADIAAIFGVTQAAISYRLDRGLQRIKFLLSIPQVSEEDLRKDLPEVFPSSSPCPSCQLNKSVNPVCLICRGVGSILIDVEILVGMWGTTCQSEVASRLGLTQGRVRHRFFKAVKFLERSAASNNKFEPYQKIFTSIASKNFNILKEVKLPQWVGRGGDECV